ncbi:PTS system transporter subunit IIC [Streptococcus pneumoniae]|nr:PTS system transporter subunit IIC [Streptococcus pneumoniae]
MNTMLDKMQEKLSPIAMKVGNQKFLVALRDSFVGTMPVIMTGSIALLLNAFLVDLPQQFHLESITKTFSGLLTSIIWYSREVYQLFPCCSSIAWE